MSNIVNKVKDALHSDKSSSNAREGEYGPHGSRVANAADPRVDSDRDNSRTVGSGRTAGSSYNEGTYGNTTEGTFGNTTEGTFGGTREGEYGPHSSRLANAADPRIDSDLDNSRNIGGAGRTAGGGLGSSGYETANTGGGFAAGAGVAGAGAGTGYSAGSGATGVTGTGGAPTGTYGPHGNRVANAVDPRVDSDLDGRGSWGGATGPGPASSTAGPHKSNLANKMDPRVDSDQDASRTLGGNRTYQ